MVGTVLWAGLALLVPAESEPLRVGYLWPSVEYGSEAGLRWMAAYLDSAHGTRSFFFAGKDEYENSHAGNPTLISNIAELDSLDVLVVYVRRMWLGEPQLQKLKDFLASGKGLVGLRTASHAIQSWSAGRGIDSVVWGGAYQDPGPKTGYRVIFTDSGRVHPIFDGVEPWPASSAMYWQNLPGRAMAPDITVHLRGEDTKFNYPIAWTRVLNGGNVFYASPGTQEDFLDPNFRRMVIRAVLWAGKRLPNRPKAPVPMAPAQGAVGVSLDPWLVWHASSGTASYQVQLAMDTAFSQVLLNDSALSVASRYVSGLLHPGREYHWRVRATNLGGTSPFSTPWRFYTLPLPDTVRVLAPASGSVIPTDSVVLQWSGDITARSYHLQISQDSTFAQYSGDSALVDTFMILRGVSSGSYWWRVRTCNSSGCGGFGSPMRFAVNPTVGTLPSFAPKVEIFGSNSRWIVFELPRRSAVRVRLVDSRGRGVTLFRETLAAGPHRLPLPPLDGFRMVELRAGNDRVLRMLSP